MKKTIRLLAAAGILLLLAGCAGGGQIMDGDGMVRSYHSISQDEAKRMMEEEKDAVIVDVRTAEEYAAGHIPGAILIPNEEIGSERPASLPDLNQVLLIYCRSGRRSKEAAGKLFEMGYLNVYEFGGILTWTGKTVTGDDPLGSVENAPDEDTPPVEEDPEPPAESEAGEPLLLIEANGTVFRAVFEENSSADALREKLREGKLEIDLSDYGHFEKVGPLPFRLPRNDEPIRTVPGDVILYQGDKITVYYDENEWTFTRLARIEGVTREELLAAFGEGDVRAVFSLSE